MTTDNDYAAYLRWWENEGSGMPPLAKEDAEEHVRRVTQAAWMSAVHCAREALAQPEPVSTEPDVDHVLSLAAIIRRVDGNHDKGAAALAEAILSHPDSRRQPREAQPEPMGPTDEEIMELMPQQMHEDLAAAARALAEQASTISRSATGVMRIMLNRHAVDLARAVLQRYGRPAITPIPVSERLPSEKDCWPEGHDKVGCCWLWAPDECLGGWEVQHRDWASDVDGDYTHWLPCHALPLPQNPAS